MLKKTITYTDYNDVNRTEDFYFNLNEAELTEMMVGKKITLDINRTEPKTNIDRLTINHLTCVNDEGVKEAYLGKSKKKD